MNRFERFLGLSTEAKVRYLDGEFQVISPGDYVTCAITGEKIPLDILSYWSVDHQEAYANAEAGFQRIVEQRAADRDSTD